MGAENIVITDLVDHRLDLARSLGAHHSLKIDSNLTEEQTIQRIHALFGGPPEITIDCGGFESTIRLSLLATRSGGCAVIVGMGCSSDVKLPILDALVREVDIRGVFRYCNDYPAALAMVANGQIDAKKLITHHFDLTETIKAFETARYGHGNPIKVMIHCDRS